MSILLSLMLAQAPVLPEIDRRALELQARAEAVQTRRPTRTTPAPRRTAATTTATTQPRRTAAVTTPTTTRTANRTTAPRTTPPRSAAQQPVRQASTQRAANPALRPASIRRAAGGALDLTAITTICRAAGDQADPATFLATLTRAYSLDGSESQSLRTSCAAYLAGRADARVNTYGAPAH